MRPRRSIILHDALSCTVLAAPAASADSISATTSLTGAPDPVTTGHTAALTTTFANGPSPAHNVEVRVTILVTAPSAPGSLDATARWSAEGMTAQLLDTSIGVVAPTPDDLSEWVLPQGATVTTDPGTGATTQNPQVTTAEVPATDIGTSTELSEEDAAPGQFCAPYGTCFGQVSNITIGETFTPGDPLRFVFLLDKSEIPANTRITKIPMYHDGVAVANCTGSSGVASPDPCVVSRKKLKKGDVQIVVLSSTNGRW